MSNNIDNKKEVHEDDKTEINEIENKTAEMTVTNTNEPDEQKAGELYNEKSEAEDTDFELDDEEEVVNTENKKEVPYMYLFELPLLQICNIVRRLDPLVVTHMTLIQDAMFNEVQKFKIIGNILTYKVWNGYHSLYMEIRGVDLHIRFGKYKTYPNDILVKVNGIETMMELSFNECPPFQKLWKIKNPEGMTELQCMSNLLEHVLKIIRFKEYKYFSNAENQSEIQNVPIWKYGFKFKFVHIDRSIMQPEDLTFVLDKVKSKSLRLMTNVEGIFVRKEPFNCESLILHQSNWVNIESFLGNNLVKCHLMENFHDDDNVDPNSHFPHGVNAVVKNWVNGGNKNLEQFSLTANNIPKQYHLAYADVETTATMFSEKDFRNHHFWSPMNAEYRDVRRKSDGCVATLQIGEFCCAFRVWKEKDFDLFTPATQKKLKKMLEESRNGLPVRP